VVACGVASYWGGGHRSQLSDRRLRGHPDDGGYYLVASDGGIFGFGDARFWLHGRYGAEQTHRRQAVDPAPGGYWLVASDGGIFAFNTPFHGSTGNIALNKPIVGMAASGNGSGYWLVASDGGIFSFNAPFLGSTGNIVLNRPISGMEAATTGSGYRFVGSDGGVFDYGSTFFGSTVEPPAVTTPPGSPPTCSLTLSSFPADLRGAQEATVTSNIPNYQVVLAKIYTTTTAYDAGFSTDANGHFALIFGVATASKGQTAFIAAAIGPAFCFATFTPS
jgi:hypothetical protein